MNTEEQSLFLVDSLGALRHKISHLEEPLQQVWNDMKAFVRNRPGQSWMIAPFVAVVTGEQAYIDIARAEMLNYLHMLPGRSLAQDVQEHFWCPSFQVARSAIYFSWLKEMGWLSAAEAADGGQILIDYAFAHIFTSGETKPLTNSNNQSLSLAFGCMTVGHLLGYRIGSSPTARHIMTEGLQRIRLQLTRYPVGGWGGEGSTYQMGVVGPAIALSTMVLEAITGTDLFDYRESEAFATPHEVVLMAHRCTLADGLALPWDNYGFFESNITLSSTVLAHKTGDASYLNWIIATRNFKPYVCFGWGRDEKVLTLLFWPDNARATSPRAFTSWALPIVGASFVSRDESVNYFQMCDEHGAGPGVMRPNCNPNVPVYTAFGANLFVDGSVTHDEVFRFKDCLLRRPHIGGFHEINYSYGGPGAHSCVLIDGQEEYIPTQATHGLVEKFADLGIAGLIASESASSYLPTYDVTSVKRTAALLANGRVLLLRDRILAETAHRFQSRFYLRPDLAVGQLDGRPHFTVDTPEMVRFHLIPLSPCRVETRALDGFPQVFEQRSAVVDFHHDGKGTSSTFDLLIIAEPRVQPLAEVTDGWQVWGGTDAEHQAPRHVAMALDGYLTTNDAVLSDAVVTLRKTLEFSAEQQGRKVFLRLPRGLRTCPVLVNGKPVEIALPEKYRPKSETAGCKVHAAADLLHPWVALGIAGKDFALSCEVTVVFTRIPGSDHLYSDHLTNAFLHGNGAATLGVEMIGAYTPQIELAEGQLHVRGIGPAPLHVDYRGLNSGELATDDGGNVAYLQRQHGEGDFTSSRPINVSFSSDIIQLGELDEPFQAQITRYAAPVEVSFHEGYLKISYAGTTPLRLAFPRVGLLAVTVNDRLVELSQDRLGEVILRADLPASESPVGAQDAAMRLCYLPVREDATTDELLRLLQSESWQVRMGAAIAFGERREAAAVPALLQLLASEKDSEIFENQVEKFWFVDHNPVPFVVPVDAEKEPGRFAAWSRRWRLKGQTARALGKIGGPHVEEALLASIAEGQDFHYYICVFTALEMCGTAQSLPTLRRYTDFAEYCTGYSARQAIAVIEIREKQRLP